MTALILTPTSPWRWPPLLRASVGLHGAAAVAAVAEPGLWPWALGAVAANHAVVTAAGLLPRCDWLGENLRRLPTAATAAGGWALTLDDGPDPEVTPTVLDLLDRLGLKASFFCIAARAEREPALVREIMARGHSVQNHTHAHRHDFSLRGPRGFESEILKAQDTLTRLTGQRPTCFRAPAGLRNPFLAPVLHRLGLRLVSWTRRAYDTREGRPDRVGERLLRGFSAGDILLLHDGHAARDPRGQPVLLEVLPRLAQAARSQGLRSMTLPQALQMESA